MSGFAKPERVREVGEYAREHGSEATAVHFRITPASLERYLRAYKRLDSVPAAGKRTEKSDDTKDQTRTITTRSADITTLEQLLEYSAVDLSVWEVERHIVNSWEVTTAGPPPATYTNYQVKAWLRLSTQPSSLDWLDEFREQAQVHSPKYPKIKRIHTSAPVLAEVDIFDPHVGKLAWHVETGGPDYDLRIAERVYSDAVNELAAYVAEHKPERILYPVGNDFFHSNNARGETAAGTRLDVEGRFPKAFGIGAALVVRSAELLSTIAPVDIVMIQGNHDPETSYYLGEYLSAWFRSSKDVTVDNRPISRKYILYGKCLIGLTHGDIKLDQLPLLMATESAEQWAAAAWREWRVGHLHHSNIKSYQQETEQAGCRVVMVPSLSPADLWHAKNGFLAQREAQAAIWHRDSGKIATYYHRP